MTFDILLTLFLVLLNGFFVAAEFAIVKVRSSQIEVSLGRSAAVSNVARSIVNNLDGYLAATQLGITLASLGLGWVGEDVMTALILSGFGAMGLQIEPATAHKIALPLAFFCITVLHIVFGELAPKSLAIRKPVPTTFAVALPLKAFYMVFRPFIWMLNGFANAILKLVGITPINEHGDIHSEEELKVIIAESHQGGVIEETEKALIQNVFNLGDRQASTLMTPRNELVWLNVNDPAEVNRKKILDNKHTLYPLTNGDLDSVYGFVYSKDLLNDNLVASLQKIETYKRKLLLITTHNRTYQILDLFRKEKVYQAMVVDEFGAVKGMITINDIVDALVGDISETNEFTYDMKRQDDGSFLVDAQIPFVEFLERMHIQVDQKKINLVNFATLGGFILDRLGRIPAAGDSLKWRGLRFEVRQMDQHRIVKVEVRDDV